MLMISGSVALFVLFAAAAGAGIVAPDFHWAGGARRGRGAIAAGAGSPAFCRFGAFVATIVFRLAAGFGNIIDVGAQVARRRFTLWLRLIERQLEVAAHHLEQGVYSIMLDRQFQLCNHAKGFFLNLDRGSRCPIERKPMPARITSSESI